LFLTQILRGNTAINHLVRISGRSFTGSAYCQARSRLPLALFQELLRRVAHRIRPAIDDTGKWHGHRVFVADGSSFSMPDTPELQEHFGQPSIQQPGCGFPVAHLLALFHVGTGMLIEVLTAPLCTHDMSGVAHTTPVVTMCSCMRIRAGPRSWMRTGSNEAPPIRPAIPLLNWIITTYNWHYAFGALGLVGLLWVIAWVIFGKEGRLEESTAAEGTAAVNSIPYRDLLLSSTNLASWSAHFGSYFGLALVLSWFTPYLIMGLGFEQAIAGKLTALPFVVGFFVVPGGSWLSQRMMRSGSSSRTARGIFCGGAICLGGVALLAAAYAPNVTMKIALIVAGRRPRWFIPARLASVR
jgi:hypothetical protein